MAARRRLFSSLLAGMSAAGALVACQSTPEIDFPSEDAESAVDATVGTDGSQPDASAPDAASTDAGPGDSTMPLDAGMDARDANPPADANTCGLGEDAPPGAACCGVSQCIGAACSHCPACIKAGCAAVDEWCCAVENPAGKYMSTQCSSDPEDASACPLTAK